MDCTFLNKFIISEAELRRKMTVFLCFSKKKSSQTILFRTLQKVKTQMAETPTVEGTSQLPVVVGDSVNGLSVQNSLILNAA